MVKDKNGLVAIRYKQPAPKYVRIQSSGQEYIFTPQHSVSLAWVQEADVEQILMVKGGCCGGEQLIFSLASEAAVRTWKTGER